MNNRLILFVLAGLSFAGCASRQIDCTQGKLNICELHHVAMEKAIVPVAYGLFPMTEQSAAMYEAGNNSFPHAQTGLNPGCVVASPKRAVVYVSQKCKEARREWEARYTETH